jgi:hypothetical protein
VSANGFEFVIARGAEPGCNVAAPRPPNANFASFSGKQRRFLRHENHCISKAIVLEAQHSGRGVGLEELKDVHERVKASRPQRARNWSFRADILRVGGPTCRHPCAVRRPQIHRQRVERPRIRTDLTKPPSPSCRHADVSPQHPLPSRGRARNPALSSHPSEGDGKPCFTCRIGYSSRPREVAGRPRCRARRPDSPEDLPPSRP